MEPIVESYLIVKALYDQWTKRSLYAEYKEVLDRHMSLGPIKIKLFKADDTVTEYDFESISELLEFQKGIGPHSVKIMDGVICIVMRKEEKE